jgi:hypothetical protein
MARSAAGPPSRPGPAPAQQIQRRVCGVVECASATEPICLRAILRFKDRFLLCATNNLVSTRRRRVAQAARKLCGSFEQRRDLGNCPTFTSLNAEPVV